MDKTTAQTSIKNLYAEAFSLNPSSLISLFVIDVGQIAFNRGIVSQTELDSEINTVFRFHNIVKLGTTSIFWQKKEYVACPVEIEGFEMTTKGTLATPRIRLAVSDDGIPLLSVLKDKIYSLAGDLVGAKVTRIRTFAKYIDIENYYDNIAPPGFLPDPNCEFPRDIYFIDRKSAENKNILEFELASALDVEGIKLPGRIISSNTCPYIYRGGQGCPYEFASRRNTDLHEDATLPPSAKPIANSKDELYSVLFSGINLTDKGEYNRNTSYAKGQYVFVKHNGVNYYFISKLNNNSTPPPELNHWFPDECSKHLYGCELRFGQGADAASSVAGLPFGGFVSVTRFK